MSSISTGAQRRARLAAARLYLVCPATAGNGSAGDRALGELLRAAITGGVDIVQLREKRMEDRELVVLARSAKELCAQLGALLIVNDRPAVAREAGADGVHVGQDDMAVADVRELVGDDLLVGLSTHAPREIDAALPVAAGGSPAVDYIGVGPVHETPTKLGRAAVGVELVSYAVQHAAVPFFAIGGIDAHNVDDVLAAGARAVCVLRAVADAESPRAAARGLCELLDARGAAS